MRITPPPETHKKKRDAESSLESSLESAPETALPSLPLQQSGAIAELEAAAAGPKSPSSPSMVSISHCYSGLDAIPFSQALTDKSPQLAPSPMSAQPATAQILPSYQRVPVASAPGALRGSAFTTRSMPAAVYTTTTTTTAPRHVA